MRERLNETRQMGRPRADPQRRYNNTTYLNVTKRNTKHPRKRHSPLILLDELILRHEAEGEDHPWLPRGGLPVVEEDPVLAGVVLKQPFEEGPGVLGQLHGRLAGDELGLFPAPLLASDPGRCERRRRRRRRRGVPSLVPPGRHSRCKVAPTGRKALVGVRGGGARVSKRRGGNADAGQGAVVVGKSRQVTWWAELDGSPAGS